MPTRRKELISLFAIILASAWIFHRLIAMDPVLERDDAHILGHLHGASAILDLLKDSQLGNVIAYQPVRDFTYFADIAISKHLGLSSFHFSGFLIWIGIILCVHAILRSILESQTLALKLTALFALHPVFVGSVGWIAARKHLLSCLFALLATLCLIRFQREGRRKVLFAVSIAFLYSLSVLSQPITLLWPLWAVVHCLCIPRESRRNGLFLLPAACLPILLLGGLANYHYYSTLYPIHTAALKWVDPADNPMGVAFLALGRYFFNLFVPARLALVYYPGSLVNVIGLGLGALFIGALVLKSEFRKWFPWLVFFLFPLLPVTVRMTNVFVSDTYVLTASVGWVCLVGLLATSAGKSMAGPIGNRTLRDGAYLALLGTFCFLSLRQASAWESDRKLWMSSYATEPAPRSLVFNAKYLMEDGRYPEAMREALLLEAWVPGHEDFPYLFSRSVYLNPDLTTPAKLDLLERHANGNPWSDYYRASLDAGQGRFSEALALMREALKSPAAFSDEFSVVCAEADYICRKSGQAECGRLIDAARSTAKNWNEKRYSARLEELAGK